MRKYGGGVISEIWAVVDDAKSGKYKKIRDEYVTVQCYPRVKTPFGKHEIIEDLEREKDSIDLVHFHMIWFYDKNIIADALIKMGIPYIVTTHGTYSNPHAYTGKRLLAKYLFELDYLNKAEEIHIITRNEGTGLLKYGYSGKTFIAYNGIELSEIPQKYNVHFFDKKKYKDKIKLGWVGVLRSDKNLDSLVKAVALLPMELREEFIIILVGPDYRHNAEKYLKLAQKLGCRENFDWIGPLYNQEKYDAYYNFDAYLMPSFSEGFSMAILDAMACSKPCMLTRGCGMEYFNSEDKKFFVMCEPYSYDLACGLTKLLKCRDEWPIMGANAKRWVDEEFNWETISKVLIQNYKRIIGEYANVE